MISRHRMWDLLNRDENADRTERRLQAGLMVLILLNLVAVMLESVASLNARFGRLFDLFEFFSVAVFSLEYAARVWSCTADPRYAHPVRGRLRFMFTPMALLDLAAVLPSYLLFLNLDLRMVRSLRLIRLLRVGKMGRYTEASGIILRVLHAKRAELAATMTMLFALAVICATLMYYAEQAAQPDKFSSIPAALWWAFITITTIGYGDAYPVTALGKVIGVATGILGILMIALPTGVFGAAFVEEISKKGRRTCPHCGKEI